MSVNICDLDSYNDRNQPSVFQTATPYAIGSLALAGGGIALATSYVATSTALAVSGVALALFGAMGFFVTVATAVQVRNSREFNAVIGKAFTIAGAVVVTEMISVVAERVLLHLIDKMLNRR